MAEAGRVFPSSDDADFLRPLRLAELELEEGRGESARNRRAVDAWNFRADAARGSPFFWEFKYFSFNDSRASGNVTFFTVAPKWSGKMIALAQLFVDGRILTHRKLVDLSCVRGSKKSAALTLCGGDGIEVLAPDRYRLSLTIGSVQWRLDFSGRREPGPLHHVPLDGWLVWEMFWRPVFVRAVVSGTIQGEHGVVTLREAPAYHDQNWGRWNPAKHPYRWLRFSGLDSEGLEVDVLLADFFENRSDSSGGLTLWSGGESRRYGRGEWEFRVLRWGRSPTLRFSLDQEGEIVHAQAPSPSFSEGDHDVPTAFSLRSADGSLSIEAETLLNAASGPDIPMIWKAFFGDFIIDVQVVRARLRFTDSAGRPRTADGLAEFQTVSRP